MDFEHKFRHKDEDFQIKKSVEEVVEFSISILTCGIESSYVTSEFILTYPLYVPEMLYKIRFRRTYLNFMQSARALTGIS